MRFDDNFQFDIAVGETGGRLRQRRRYNGKRLPPDVFTRLFPPDKQYSDTSIKTAGKTALLPGSFFVKQSFLWALFEMPVCFGEDAVRQPAECVIQELFLIRAMT